MTSLLHHCSAFDNAVVAIPLVFVCLQSLSKIVLNNHKPGPDNFATDMLSIEAQRLAPISVDSLFIDLGTREEICKAIHDFVWRNQ